MKNALHPIMLSAGLSAALLVGGAGAAPDRPPNIIFILFDDLGYGEPACYRSASPFQTPNLDRLAREGMRFTDAHSASSVCTPTRYAVLTGRYPWRAGQFGVLAHTSPPLIPADRLTVAGLLKSNGYHTACFGKWHLGLRIDGREVRDGPLTRGFDVFCGYTEARSIGTIIEQDALADPLAPVEVAPMLERKTVAYLDERARDGRPFFLYVPLSQPHLPHMPAPDFRGRSGAKEYGDWMLQGDATVGRILAALDRHQLASNTLVLVTSDNGAQGRVYPPLRGCKASIWEGGHRVPFLARWPGRIQAGSTCCDTICLGDLLATCADLVGAKLPDEAAEDSVSLLPDLLGRATGPVREATVHQSMRGDLAIRAGPWKLVFLKDGGRELYNLETDLGETRDRAAAEPEVAARLAARMQRYIEDGRSTPGAPQKNGAVVSLQGGRGKGRRPAVDQKGTE